MKKLSFLFLTFFLGYCSLKQEQKKPKRFYIYSTSNNCSIINWYCYSNIGSFSGSKVEFISAKNGDSTTIESYYLSNIEIFHDTLKLQLWSSDTSGLNLHKIPCFTNIQIDTTGDQNKNGIDARVSRIISAKVDYTKPHNFYSTIR